MQPEHAVDVEQLGRLDQFRMSDGNCEQRAIERCLPESQKILRRREIRKQIVILPDVSSADGVDVPPPVMCHHPAA